MYPLDGTFSDTTSSLQVGLALLLFLPFLPMNISYTLTDWQIELCSTSILLLLGGLDFKTLEKRGLILVDYSRSVN